MSAENATAEYLDFLLARGAATHVVSAPAGATLSTLALTQRCLASGVDFPVPLPDGTVAIKLDGAVPLALSALDLSIVDLRETAAEAPAPEPEAMPDSLLMETELAHSRPCRFRRYRRWSLPSACCR